MSFHLPKTTAVDLDRGEYKEGDVGGVTATLTSAQLLSGILNSDPSGGAITLTLPTAALLVDTDTKAAVGTGFSFYLRNDNAANAITVAVGTGGTLKGSATVAALGYSQYYVRYTDVTASSEAYDVIRLL